jgi:hypothetical protein
MNIIKSGMNTEELRRLIGKYYDGDTTVEEELALKEHFRNGNVDEQFMTEKEIFECYSSPAEVPEPSAGFESGILDAITASDAADKKLSHGRIFLLFTGIAAGFLLLLGLWFAFEQGQRQADTFKDPEVAYTECMKVLLNVSARMNRGTGALHALGRMDEVTSKSLGKVSRSAGKMGRRLDDLQSVLEPLARPAGRENDTDNN